MRWTERHLRNHSELLEAAGGGYDADSDGVRSEAEDTVDAPQAANGGHNKPLNVAAAPAAPPRALQTPLGLPHPTVHATLCAELWDHATSSPDRTARKVRAWPAQQRQCQWVTAYGCQPSDGAHPRARVGASLRQRALHSAATVAVTVRLCLS